MPNPAELLQNRDFRRKAVRVASTIPLAGTVLGIACNASETIPSPPTTPRPAIVEPTEPTPTGFPTPTFVEFETQPTPTPIVKEDPEEKKGQSLKKRVLAFTWQDVENKEKFHQFIETLADSYLELTQTPRLTKDDLLGEGKITFYNNSEKFYNAIRDVEPRFQYTPQFGYTHFPTKKVFIDLTLLRPDSAKTMDNAGQKLIAALWHEWGHLDITPQTQGELLNNVSRSYFFSPISNENEPYRLYRGVEVYTDTYYGFSRLEEILNETITVRRLREQVGFGEINSAEAYHRIGVDFLPEFTRNAGISLTDLYTYHATSNFEGLAKRIGTRLEGNDIALIKGKLFFIGIHNKDVALLYSLGVALSTP